MVPLQAADRSSLGRLEAGIRSGEFGALVLFASPRTAADLAVWLRERGHTLPLYASLALAVPEFLSRAGHAADGMVMIAPSKRGALPEEAFRREFQKAYGDSATALACYGHDAVLALVAALRQRREGTPLEDVLAAVSVPGATGKVRFDGHRSRSAAPGLAVVTREGLVPEETNGVAQVVRKERP